MKSRFSKMLVASEEYGEWFLTLAFDLSYRYNDILATA
jgi:hypothetical protein